ncbi:hypothetical protein MMC25_005527 [Agyrium rufum]|nr:hypothetical protein [Agyrium rufum]
MISCAIEALYIFNLQNESILEHTYRSRPASTRQILPHYLSHASPRPSLIYVPEINPPTTIFSLAEGNVYFLVPSSVDTEPLFVLEFLRRVVDVLEEYLGSPLLAHKIESNYDVVAQLLGEMCDAGALCNTEPNALRDVVQTAGWVGKLLGGVGLPGSSPSILPSGGKASLALNPATAGPAIPWRRPNVRHTSNELYVDIVESLLVTVAPSGRPLAAIANGSIAFTAKISGVPDLILNLSCPGGRQAMLRTFELPVFHPCVRLNRWKEKPGELSFVPPDGKFMLAGYEVNLLPPQSLGGGTLSGRSMKALNLPAWLLVSTSLGLTGCDFEVKLVISSNFASSSSSTSLSSLSSLRPGGGQTSRSTAGRSGPVFSTSSRTAGSSASPSLLDVSVRVPIPEAVRNMTDIRVSRGDATYIPSEQVLEWRIPSKEVSSAGNATLRCTVVGPLVNNNDDDDDDGNEDDEANGVNDIAAATPAPSLSTGTQSFKEYDENEDSYQSQSQSQATSSSTLHPPPSQSTSTSRGGGNSMTTALSRSTSHSSSQTTPRDKRKVQQNAKLMPTSASVSFSVKGWLASGIKVDGLNVDMRRSRGLGEGVKPYKGVKYLTVSRDGVETRC